MARARTMGNFDPARYKRERQNRRAAERLDVLEAPRPRWRGCNARDRYRVRCGRRVVERRPGHFGLRRLCATHAALYAAHDRIVLRVLAIPARRV